MKTKWVIVKGDLVHGILGVHGPYDAEWRAEVARDEMEKATGQSWSVHPMADPRT